MYNVIVPLLLLVDGLAGIFLAIFAHALGLDPSPGWGSTRVIILVGGVAFVIAAIISFSARKPSFLKPLEQTERATIFLLMMHLWLAVIIVYAWFATYGNFTTWNHTSHYFERLAEAFQQRHLYIDIDPGDAFLQSPNPYDPKTRAPFPDEIWDMSLYKGKLYYYWGPAPALVILPLQSLFNLQVSDIFITFFFAVGLLVFNSLIILKLRQLFFPQIGIRNITLAILFVGLILPILWNMSSPYVYAAAVCTGAFFMMGGIYFTIVSLEHTPTLHRGQLFLAGTFFVFAVGSRALQALSVFFVALLVLVWIGKIFPSSPRRTELLTGLFSFFAPLVIGAIVIGWYNWARFDSPFEFGLQYQITTYDMANHTDLIFKPDYLFLNLYAYILQPFETIAEFPFLRPLVLSDVLRGFGIAQPYFYYGGRVTGILFGAPILVFGLQPVFSAVKVAKQKIGNLPQLDQFHLLVVSILFGTFLAGFLSLLFYFNAQTRFQTDAISQIALLAVLGYWSLVTARKKTASVWAYGISILLNGLMVFTILAGFLLAVTGELDRLQTLNPKLFEAIVAGLH